MPARIEIPKDKIAAFCQRHRIRKLSLFGSVLRDDFRPDSDVDVLVEFAPEAHPTFFDVIHAEDDFRKLLHDGRKLDFMTMGAIHSVIQDEVMNTREVVYES